MRETFLLNAVLFKGQGGGGGGTPSQVFDGALPTWSAAVGASHAWDIDSVELTVPGL